MLGYISLSISSLFYSDELSCHRTDCIALIVTVVYFFILIAICYTLFMHMHFSSLYHSLDRFLTTLNLRIQV